MVAFALAAAWLVLAIPGGEQPSWVLVGYGAAWCAALALARRHGTRLARWLPAAPCGVRRWRGGVSPPLLRVSIPVITLVLTMLYARGAVL